MQPFKQFLVMAIMFGLISMLGLGLEHSMTVGTYEIWVANQGLDTIQIFDGNTFEMVSEIKLDADGEPATSKPHMVLFSPDYKFAYVANVGRGTVSIIQADTRQIIAQIPTGKGAHAAVPSPDGKRVFVANVGENTVTEIITDTENGIFKVGRTIPTGTRPICLMFTADSKKAYVSLGGDPKAQDPTQTGGIQIIDVAQGAVVKHFPNTGQNGCGLIRSPLSGRAMYANVGEPIDQVMVIDTKFEEIVYKGSTHTRDTHGMWLTSDGTELWVFGRQENQVVILDTISMKMIDTIEVGDKPDIADSSPDENLLFFTMRGEAVTGDVHSISGNTAGIGVIDIARREQIRIISLSGDPHGLAVRLLRF